MAKVAVVITDMFEDSEFSDPVKAFDNEGHHVTTIGKKVNAEITGLHGKTLTTDKGIKDVNAHDFDALFIPGGFSPDILRADDRFVTFVHDFMDPASQKPVFAICHGPQLLITAKTLKNRHVTGYKSIIVDLENAGAVFHDDEVIVCKNQLVTSRNPDDIPAFIQESLNLL